VIDYAPKGSTFDLLDDHRDRLEEMKVALGCHPGWASSGWQWGRVEAATWPLRGLGATWKRR